MQRTRWRELFQQVRGPLRFHDEWAEQLPLYLAACYVPHRWKAVHDTEVTVHEKSSCSRPMRVTPCPRVTAICPIVWAHSMSLHICVLAALSHTHLLGPLSLCITVSCLPVCESKTSLRATAFSYRLLILEKTKVSLECNECFENWENKSFVHRDAGGWCMCLCVYVAQIWGQSM